MLENYAHGVGTVDRSVLSEYDVDTGTGYIKISPTDISQFIRLEQCQRYLRLRLHERANGRDFLSNYGVYPQTIPPLLTRSGQSFEDAVEHSVSTRHPSRNLAKEGSTRRTSDNDLLVEMARSLPPGEIAVLFQLRLDVPIGEWWFRGDIDILRLERAVDGTLHLLIADMKSSAEAKTEHRLQVAFYHEMLALCVRLFCPILLRSICRSGAGPELAKGGCGVRILFCPDILDLYSQSVRDAFLRAGTRHVAPPLDSGQKRRADARHHR